jgi:hypothetical protein
MQFFTSQNHYLNYIGEIPHLYGGLQYLNYYIEIEKNCTCNISPKQTELIKKKWLNVEVAMNG